MVIQINGDKLSQFVAKTSLVKIKISSRNPALKVPKVCDAAFSPLLRIGIKIA